MRTVPKVRTLARLSTVYKPFSDVVIVLSLAVVEYMHAEFANACYCANMCLRMQTGQHYAYPTCA